MKLTKAENDWLSNYLVSEMKKIQHYSIEKSKMLISISIKVELDEAVFLELTDLFKEYYKIDY